MLELDYFAAILLILATKYGQWTLFSEFFYYNNSGPNDKNPPEVNMPSLKEIFTFKRKPSAEVLFTQWYRSRPYTLVKTYDRELRATVFYWRDSDNKPVSRRYLNRTLVEIEFGYFLEEVELSIHPSKEEVQLTLDYVEDLAKRNHR